ncbi:MAG TPA: glycosyltransferase [Thermoanaerobaculia bacterium]|jgi:spore maturation protein CgeB|nr:glycosyltransferase [Thermoanaerobaculia bacterium]
MMDPNIGQKTGQRIAFFGSSLVSSYWNGAATYYRGLLKALAERGHAITFYEPDAFERQQHRDMPDPDWARVVVYPAEESAALAMLDRARGADLVVKASGVGVFDELLEREVLTLQRPATRVVFWDVDAPATLERMAADPADPFRPLVPRYDLILTYGGGPPVVAAYRRFGARDCIPVYNALDPSTHHIVPPDPRFSCDLGFLGNRLPDREERVKEFLCRPAAALPQRTFLLGGSGWEAGSLPANVRPLGHVGTRDHNAFNCTPRAVLNVNRDSMARFGHSPATRLFEAAGAAACIVSDAWDGIEAFLEPGEEVLLARGGDEVAALLEALSPERAHEIGLAARRRVHREHTYRHRAEQVEAILEGREIPAEVRL